MKNFFKKQEKNKYFSNLNIILASLVIALGINVFFINGTNIGSQLKTSVLNSNINSEGNSNLYVEKIENEFYIISDKNINDIVNLSLSLAYNHENITINNIDSSFGDVTKLSNSPGIESLILTGKEIFSINKGDKILKIDMSKKENKAENLNILNANFKDKLENKYELSTSGITF